MNKLLMCMVLMNNATNTLSAVKGVEKVSKSKKVTYLTIVAGIAVTGIVMLYTYIFFTCYHGFSNDDSVRGTHFLYTCFRARFPKNKNYLENVGDLNEKFNVKAFDDDIAKYGPDMSKRIWRYYESDRVMQLAIEKKVQAGQIQFMNELSANREWCKNYMGRFLASTTQKNYNKLVFVLFMHYISLQMKNDDLRSLAMYSVIFDHMSLLLADF